MKKIVERIKCIFGQHSSWFYDNFPIKILADTKNGQGFRMISNRLIPTRECMSCYKKQVKTIDGYVNIKNFNLGTMMGISHDNIQRKEYEQPIEIL